MSLPQGGLAKEGFFPRHVYLIYCVNQGQDDTQARALIHHSTSSQAEPAKLPDFHAAPVPRTLYRPAQLPAVPEAKPTEQQAFQLLSEARHQQVRRSPASHAEGVSACMLYLISMQM